MGSYMSVRTKKGEPQIVAQRRELNLPQEKVTSHAASCSRHSTTRERTPRALHRRPHPRSADFISTASTLPRAKARSTLGSRESSRTAASSHESAMRPPAPG